MEEFEAIELEYSESDILYYLIDEDDVEVGFVVEEDGREVEYYYEEFINEEFEIIEAIESPAEQSADNDKTSTSPAPAKASDYGYLHKLASIAGHEGSKARDKVEDKLETIRDKTEIHADKARQIARDKADDAKRIATSKTKQVKSKADDAELGITRESVTEATADLNAIAKEGAETAKELKEAYDDIMETFGFLVPKKIKRRLP